MPVRFNPTLKMCIRPATHADLPGILEIYNDAVLRTTATYDYEPRTLEHRTQWFEERQRDNYLRSGPPRRAIIGIRPEPNYGPRSQS